MTACSDMEQNLLVPSSHVEIQNEGVLNSLCGSKRRSLKIADACVSKTQLKSYKLGLLVGMRGT